jgi:dCTP deaminase
MALNCNEIKEEMKNGNIVINPFNESNLQVNSYDVTLGENYYIENEEESIYNIWNKRDVDRVWSLKKAGKNYNNLEGTSIDDKIIWLEPGERILGHTQEFIGGKNKITTMMKARSSMNRNFISVCLCAGLGDIGYTNRWTLEITNHSRYHSIPLVVGRRIAQIVFFRTGELIGELNESYTSRGKYQNKISQSELESGWSPEDMLPKMYLDKEIQKEDKKE